MEHHAGLTSRSPDDLRRSATDQALLDAIMTGAVGYVLKQIRGTDLVSAARLTVASAAPLPAMLDGLAGPGTAVVVGGAGGDAEPVPGTAPGAPTGGVVQEIRGAATGAACARCGATPRSRCKAATRPARPRAPAPAPKKVANPTATGTVNAAHSTCGQ